MKLQIKNIAKVKEAEILIDGITVIAGENNTGKSTVGKVLFTLFDALQNIDVKVRRQRSLRIKNVLKSLLPAIGPEMEPGARYRLYKARHHETLMSLISACTDGGTDFSREKLLEMYTMFQKRLDGMVKIDVGFDDFLDKVMPYIEVPDIDFAKEVVRTSVFRIFNGQVNFLGAPDEEGVITAILKNKPIQVKFSQHSCNSLEIGTALNNKVIYIDNPYMLDKLSSESYGEEYMNAIPISANVMEDRLLEMLERGSQKRPEEGALERVLQQKSLARVIELINSAIEASVIKTEEGYALREAGTTYDVKFQNLSLGVRAFVALKMLIENNVIQHKDVLVLDEPEIHLHPKWQVIYAHLIVLLQKELELSIVVTTHSHFFVDAINLYSRKYETSSYVHYFLSALKDNRSVISEIPANNLEPIYQMMASAVDTLDELRSELAEKQ